MEGRERHIWAQDGGVFVSCTNQGREEQANLHQAFYHSDYTHTGEGEVHEDTQPQGCCTMRELDVCVGRRGNREWLTGPVKAI